jgi:hypothetical protein
MAVPHSGCTLAARCSGNTKSVSLAMLQDRGVGALNLPTAAHLRAHLAAPLMPWVAEWETLLAPSIQAGTRVQTGRLNLNQRAGHVTAEALAAAFERLADEVIRL